LPDRAGREQRGRRPAIIWQDMAGFAVLPTLLIIPLTSRLDARRLGQKLGHLDPGDLTAIQEIARKLQRLA
jgi:mRNA-degrading endonuclease toxin of MazEF toxin-antitoxin module